jgi:hypothetical protein
MGFFLVFLIPLFSINANPLLDQGNWAVRGSILYFGADYGKQGADPAAILPSLGGTFSYKINDNISLEFTEDFYLKNYEYNSELQYAMACNLENRSALVLGFITGLQLTYSIPIAQTGFGLRFFAGPGMDIRVVVLAAGLKHPADFTGEIETDARLQTEAIRKYFWSSGRWFYPVAGVGVDYAISEKFLLGLDFRVWFPVYRMSVDQHLPSIDGWRFGAGFRISPRNVGLRRKKEVEQVPVNQEVIYQPVTIIQPEIEHVEEQIYPGEHMYEHPDELTEESDFYEEENIYEEIDFYEEDNVYEDNIDEENDFFEEDSIDEDDNIFNYDEVNWLSFGFCL